MHEVVAADWLATGGAYYVLALEWIGSAVFWVFLALQIGKGTKNENDGCLLAIANVLLSLTGGGIGFFLARYPLFLLTSLVGALLLPGLATQFASRKMRR